MDRGQEDDATQAVAFVAPEQGKVSTPDAGYAEGGSTMRHIAADRPPPRAAHLARTAMPAATTRETRRRAAARRIPECAQPDCARRYQP
jgi:hypothetical protein